MVASLGIVQQFFRSLGRRTTPPAPRAGRETIQKAAYLPGKQASSRRLSTLGLGQCATVRALDGALQGLARWRLLDLGLTPGAMVAAEMSSLLHDPRAYRVRGALIALRGDEARHVLIDPGPFEGAGGG